MHETRTAPPDAPYKQGKLLPGTHIPIYAPAKLDQARPDYVLIPQWVARGGRDGGGG